MVQDEALAGMVIIAQGESGEKEDKFYVLEHGRAQVKVNGDAKGYIEPGSAFGEVRQEKRAAGKASGGRSEPWKELEYYNPGTRVLPSIAATIITILTQ
jgi:hypothetical protein